MLRSRFRFADLIPSPCPNGPCRLQRKGGLLAVLLLLLGLGAGGAADAAEEVNIYSARHYDTDLTLYDRFTEETGIRVNLIEGSSSELIERLANEGRNSPADLLITVDAGNLWRADQRGVFQPVASPILEERIPPHLRHPDGHWFALSKRARVVIYNKEVGLPEGLEDYEDLADPAYRGTICVRSSNNIYNQSLLASLVWHLGPEKAEEWAKGVVANFARRPQGNDTAQIEAVAAGACRLGIVNTYYVGRLLGSDDAETRTQAERIGILFPNQGGRGTHVNISGIGVTQYAPHRDNAIRFIEYMTSEFAQRIFAEGNNEYPTVIGQEATGPIASFGSFQEDELNATELGANQPEAVRIFDRAGWP